MLPPDLRLRQKELQKKLSELSGSTEIVLVRRTQGEGGEVRVQMESSARLRPTKMKLSVLEEFTDIDIDTPLLYSFQYKLINPEKAQEPIFRYECHPDVGDPIDQSEEGDTNAFRSPYGLQPHFHPDGTSVDKICKLHFPFHRSERREVVFALIQWMRVDFLRRFYPTNSGVDIKLASDGKTSVSITNLRTGMVFERMTIRLEPGTYEFVGTREGYKDVRVSVRVAATLSNEIKVVCSEKQKG